MNLQERLPNIYIAVDEPLQFLKRIADICENLGSLSVARNDAGFTSHRFTVRLAFIDASRSCGNSVQLFSVDNNKVTVALTIDKDEHRTYEYYTKLAKDIIKPPLKLYNLQAHTRCRLTITPKNKLQPKLPPATAKLFAYFVNGANTSALHDTDWRRFYEFVRASRRNVSSCDLTYLLVEAGFSEEYAWHVTNIYEHLCAFMRPRTIAETHDYLHVVKGLRLHLPRS